MAAFFLRIYDWLAGRRMWFGGVLALLCALLLAGLFSLGRNEDILDFLPVDNHHRKALNLYQELSAADRTRAAFSVSRLARAANIIALPIFTAAYISVSFFIRYLSMLSESFSALDKFSLACCGILAFIALIKVSLAFSASG